MPFLAFCVDRRFWSDSMTMVRKMKEPISGLMVFDSMPTFAGGMFSLESVEGLEDNVRVHLEDNLMSRLGSMAA